MISLGEEADFRTDGALFARSKQCDCITSHADDFGIELAPLSIGEFAGGKAGEGQEHADGGEEACFHKR